MKTIFIGTYYQLKTFLRIKKALFFSFFFPSFSYVIFSMVWGFDNPDYKEFLLTGIITLTVVSDSLFSIGSVMVEYYQNGLIKFFKVIPYSFNKHLIALFLSRIIIIIFSVILVLIIAFVFDHIIFSYLEFLYVSIGVISGIIMFSFLGIIIAALTKENTQSLSITNVLFFSIIFLSETFYPLGEINKAFTKVIMINPITPILKLTRGKIDLVSLLSWIIVLAVIQYVFFVKTKITR